MQLSEQDIIKRSTENLKKTLPEMKILESMSQYQTGSYVADLVLKIRIDDVIKNLVCEVKTSGEPRYIFQAVSQVRLYSSLIENSYPVVAVPHIGEKSKEICKSFDVGYIDFDGNVYLKFDHVLIEKEGKKSLTRAKRQVKDLFAPLSSRILRILLVDPEMSWTLSQLSKTAKISIGYTHKIAKTLEERGYAIRDQNYRLKLSRPRSLLDEWASKYDFTTANTLNNFYTFERDPSLFIEKIRDVANQNNLEYALTLHAGAFLIAPYVRYTDVHAYIKPKEVNMWKDCLNLRPVESGGTVMLVEPYDEGVFWGIQKINGIKVVSNIQLYVDLFNYPARGREQAEFLREKKIRFE
jgi:hypothetical protein